MCQEDRGADLHLLAEILLSGLTGLEALLRPQQLLFLLLQPLLQLTPLEGHLGE